MDHHLSASIMGSIMGGSFAGMFYPRIGWAVMAVGAAIPILEIFVFGWNFVP